MITLSSFLHKRSRTNDQPSSGQQTPTSSNGGRADTREHTGVIAERIFQREPVDSPNLDPQIYDISPPPKRTRIGVQAFVPHFAPLFDENGCPKKPSRYLSSGHLEKKPLFLQNAVKVQQNSQIFWQGRFVSIDIQTTHKDRGQFNIFARVVNGQEDLLSEFNIKNSRIAIKTFRDHCIMIQSGKDKLQSEAHENVLNQYEQLLKAGVPVARIFNVELAGTGCGFFVVEYVPHSFDEQLWERGATLNSLSQKQMNLLTQLRNLCVRAYRADVVLDLKPENLRIRDHGTLVVIDLRENAMKAKEKYWAYEKMIRTFHCVAQDEIYNFLTEPLLALNAAEASVQQ